MNFNNQVVIITGGSSGIGLALAEILAGQGAQLFLLARREEQLAAAQQRVSAVRRRPDQCVAALPVDVTAADQVARAVSQVEDQAGRVDVLINSAGVAHPGYFHELDLDIFRWMMDVNFYGTVHTVKAVAPGMIRRRSGQIANISSFAGVIGLIGYTAYSASKFAVHGFSDALRAEMKPYGVRVSVVFPSDTDTPQLSYENQFKPPETKALSALFPPAPAEAVARSILQGMARGRYVITPGLDNTLLYGLRSITGRFAYPVLDWLVRLAHRSGHSSQNGDSQ